MKKLAVVLAGLGVAALSSACVTTRAQAPTARPALEVPPVPPRVIEPAPPPQTPQPEPVEQLPPAMPAATSKPRPSTREANNQKPEPKPQETPAVEAAAPPATAPPTSPVPPLRIARTADGVQAERQVRDIIGRANGLLGRVNYQKLTPDRQKAYNNAKQFIELAEGAIRDAKFEYALELADKAETLAKELQG